MKSKPDYTEQDFNFEGLSSEEFIVKFVELSNCKKQKKKDKSTLEKILKRLQKYDEPFAINTMEIAIINEYQGVIFPDTDVKYSNYLRQKHGTNYNQAANLQGKVVKQQQILTGSEFFNQV